MAVRVSDQFDEAGATDLDDHTPDTTGAPWVAVVADATNKMRVGAGTGTAAPATTTASEYQTDAADATTTPDQIITSNMKPGGASGVVSIYGRCDGTNQNNYRCRVASTGGVHDITLRQMVAGVETELDAYTTAIADTSTAEYKFDITDGWKRIYVDGVLRIDYTATNALTVGQRAGLRASGNTAARYNDFVLEDGGSSSSSSSSSLSSSSSSSSSSSLSSSSSSRSSSSSSSFSSSSSSSVSCDVGTPFNLTTTA